MVIFTNFPYDLPFDARDDEVCAREWIFLPFLTINNEANYCNQIVRLENPFMRYCLLLNQKPNDVVS